MRKGLRPLPPILYKGTESGAITAPTPPPHPSAGVRVWGRGTSHALTPDFLFSMKRCSPAVPLSGTSFRRLRMQTGVLRHCRRGSARRVHLLLFSRLALCLCFVAATPALSLVSSLPRAGEVSPALGRRLSLPAGGYPNRKQHDERGSDTIFTLPCAFYGLSVILGARKGSRVLSVERKARFLAPLALPFSVVTTSPTATQPPVVASAQSRRARVCLLSALLA